MQILLFICAFPFLSAAAPAGQTSAHLPQPTHFPASTFGPVPKLRRRKAFTKGKVFLKVMSAGAGSFSKSGRAKAAGSPLI